MTPADAPATRMVDGALPLATPRSWAEAQRSHVATLLVDQAHLEKKAAAGALAFLFRLTVPGDVQRGLSALAREELVHFERTLRLLSARGIALRPLRPSGYAERLKAAVARTMPQRLVDELLVAAIIEARSCERMQLLASALAGIDDEAATFYADLCEAEARHEALYRELAGTLLGAADVVRRWSELGRHEADVLRQLPSAPRLHGGLAGDAGVA